MPEWVIQLLAIGAGMLTTYGAIRADLARAIAKAEAAEKQAEKAQSALIEHLMNHA